MEFEAPEITVRSNLNSRDTSIRKIISCMCADSIEQSITNHFLLNHNIKSVLLGDANCNGVFYDPVRDEVTITVTSELEELVRYINSISIDEFDLYVNHSLVKLHKDDESVTTICAEEGAQQKSDTHRLYVNLQISAWYERILLKVRPSAFTPITKLFDNVTVELGERLDGCCKHIPRRLL